MIFLFLLFCLLFFAWQGIFLAKEPGAREEKAFVVEKGEGTREIALNLERQGFIKWSPFFRIYVYSKGIAGDLQAGDYLLSPSMNIPQLAKKFAVGDIVKEAIIIKEGWNLRDIAFELEGKGIFQAEELFELVGFPLVDYSENNEIAMPKDFSQDFDFLTDKSKSVGLEGYLFPDTYEICKGDKLEEIIFRILNNFDKKLTPELREEIKRQDKSVFEVITMASLLEKEVWLLEDKKMVAGLLWKRLESNMPLQVDATVTYITDKKTSKVLTRETKTDSLYNTYKYRGLPLGPICNPGLESIKAALDPQDSDYWYYLSKPSGETVFSETLWQHNIAKAEYLK
ncbi:endolytic transglycosylase MltG [Patescibacteria group bacterium]|nr:endolytic transglycosylase MltG [Patescibacteria group bacterium]